MESVQQPMYTAEMVACVLADFAELHDAARHYEGAVPTPLHLYVWDVEAALDAGQHTVPAIVAYLNGRANDRRS